jgi:hypothetical protein
LTAGEQQNPAKNSLIGRRTIHAGAASFATGQNFTDVQIFLFA